MTINEEILENNLLLEVQSMEQDMGTMKVSTAEEYRIAGELGIALKGKTKEIISFFKPLKEAAHQSHKMICEREKEALKPLKEMETHLSTEMVAYQNAEAQKQEQLLAQAKTDVANEVEAKLAQAVAIEEEGDMVKAELLIAEAEMTSAIGNSMVIQKPFPKVSGASTLKHWEILSIDMDKLPNHLKIPDEKAILRLIKESKGTVEILGVSYGEQEKISFRGGKVV